MEEIVAWKNAAARERLDPAHPGRLRLPDGMTSGLYKYIVFDPDRALDGQGLRRSRAIGSWATRTTCPNTDWVAENHWCVPLYYRPAERGRRHRRRAGRRPAAATASSTRGSAAAVARQEPGAL